MHGNEHDSTSTLLAVLFINGLVVTGHYHYMVSEVSNHIAQLRGVSEAGERS